jgi:hypothetical protein
MMKNPLLTILTGVTLLIGAIIMLRKRTKEATDEYAKLNRKASEYAADEKARLDMIFDKLRKTNPATKERNELVKQLKDMYPELLANMNLEKAGLQELETAYRRISASIIQKAKTTVYEEDITERYRQMAALDDSMANYFDRDFKSKTDREKALAVKNIVEKIDHDIYMKNTAKNHGLNKSIFEDYLKNYNKAQELIGRLTELSSSDLNTNLNFSTTNSTANTSISDLTSGGSKATNITINLRNLIEHFNLKTETFKEGVDKGTDELIEGLLRVVNSANRIATQ